MNKQLLLTLWLLIFWVGASSAQSKNGFDFQDALIPADKILSGNTVEELIRVFAYPKFKLNKNEQEILLADFLSYVETVQIADIHRTTDASRPGRCDISEACSYCKGRRAD